MMQHLAVAVCEVEQVAHAAMERDESPAPPCRRPLDRIVSTGGGAAGNMICVHNVVAASAVAGLVGKEGAIIRLTLLPFATYALLAGALGYAIVWYSRQGWVNPGTVIVLLIAAAVLWLIAASRHRR